MNTHQPPIIGPNPELLGDSPRARGFRARVLALRALLPDGSGRTPALSDRGNTAETRSRLTDAAVEHVSALRREFMSVDFTHDVWAAPPPGRLKDAAYWGGMFLSERGLDIPLDGIMMLRARDGGFGLSSTRDGARITRGFSSAKEMFDEAERLAATPHANPRLPPARRESDAPQSGMLRRLLNTFLVLDGPADADDPRTPWQDLYDLGALTVAFNPEMTEAERTRSAFGVVTCLREMERVLSPFGVDVRQGGVLSYSLGEHAVAKAKGQTGHDFYYGAPHLINISHSGVFAHEWFHSLDFGGRSTAQSSQKGSPFWEAYAAVRAGTRIHERSIELPDKPGLVPGYWALPSEVMARCFETWVRVRMLSARRPDTDVVTCNASSDPQRSKAYPEAGEIGTVMAIIDDLMTEVGRTQALSNAAPGPETAERETAPPEPAARPLPVEESALETPDFDMG